MTDMTHDQFPTIGHVQPVVWDFRLYVAGMAGKSETALNNLRRICELHLPGQYQLSIIDLLENPELARVDEIVGIPTVVRRSPGPVIRVIGDLSDEAKTLRSLQLTADPATNA